MTIGAERGDLHFAVYVSESGKVFARLENPHHLNVAQTMVAVGVLVGQCLMGCDITEMPASVAVDSLLKIVKVAALGTFDRTLAGDTCVGSAQGDEPA